VKGGGVALRRGRSAIAAVGFAIGLGLIAAIGGAGHESARDVDDAFAWVAHTHEVIGRLDRLELALARGDLGGARDLAGDVRALTADNPRQQLRLDVLQPLLSVEATAAAAQSDVIDAMRAEEQALLAARVERTRTGLAGAARAQIAGTAIAILVLAIAFALIRRESERRRRAIIERQQVERERDRVFDLSLDLVGVLDDDARFVRVNPAFERTLGYPPDALRGRPALDLVHPDDHTRTQAAVSRLREGVPIVAFENRWRHADGSYRWLEWTSVPDRELGLVFAIARDTTHQKAAQRQIAALNDELRAHVRAVTASNAELESFSYAVSHDLRAPLRAIDGFGAALLEDHGDHLDPEAHRLLERIRAASVRMGQLIDDLLRLSRITRGELRLAPVDVTAMCRAIVDELRARRPEPRIEVDVAPGLTVTADPQLARIAFENLLGNAWKFVRGAPRPRIEVRAEGDEILVRDNGVGFEAAHADRLFRPFQRLHRQDEFEGTGIGLATVARIVSRHGGHIRAEGAVDRGATFALSFAPR
jgi:PAS domain S-box-containing protein